MALLRAACCADVKSRSAFRSLSARHMRATPPITTRVKSTPSDRSRMRRPSGKKNRDTAPTNPRTVSPWPRSLRREGSEKTIINAPMFGSSVRDDGVLDQPVADPVLGQHVPRRGRIHLDLLAELAHVDAQILRVDRLVAPHLAQQVLAGQHLSGMDHEPFQ